MTDPSDPTKQERRGNAPEPSIVRPNLVQPRFVFPGGTKSGPEGYLDAYVEPPKTPVDFGNAEVTTLRKIFTDTATRFDVRMPTVLIPVFGSITIDSVRARVQVKQQSEDGAFQLEAQSLSDRDRVLLPTAGRYWVTYDGGGVVAAMHVRVVPAPNPMQQQALLNPKTNRYVYDEGTLPAGVEIQLGIGALATHYESTTLWVENNGPNNGMSVRFEQMGNVSGGFNLQALSVNPVRTQRFWRRDEWPAGYVWLYSGLGTNYRIMVGKSDIQ